MDKESWIVYFLSFYNLYSEHEQSLSFFCRGIFVYLPQDPTRGEDDGDHHDDQHDDSPGLEAVAVVGNTPESVPHVPTNAVPHQPETGDHGPRLLRVRQSSVRHSW